MNLPTAIPEDLGQLLAPYLVRQRWYAGPVDLPPSAIRIEEARKLCSTGGGSRHLYLVILDAAGSRYQLLVGERRGSEPAELLQGHADAVIAGLEGRVLYDATVDPELACELLAIVTGGIEVAARVRPVGAEQSNTSLVYDDRVIVKFFRRLVPGRNPDVEVTSALARVGFAHVARPLGVWRSGELDLAFAQRYLAGGSEGWALALTSLRDFYDSGVEDPASAGGDFSMEANRLGSVTAELHLAMAAAFGMDEGRADAGRWERLVSSVAERLGRAADDGLVDRDLADAAVSRLRGLDDPGPALRVHGDFHLGQTMRADDGWYVLDFEGEPARPKQERLAPTSPLKDVAGMLRSLDYAAHVALAERGSETEEMQGAARAWIAHNSAAFEEGYSTEEGVAALLPRGVGRDLVRDAFVLDKALYELDYERSYRPAWVPIPETALRRITERLAG